MSFLRIFIDLSISAIGKIRRNHRVFPKKDKSDGFVKINLGCGLRVEKGWLNIDGSLNALAASFPKSLHKIIYRLSGSKHYYSEHQYCNILENHWFLFHNLGLSLPLHDETVDYIYSSHFFEHIFKDEASSLLAACAKSLKRGGIIRISIPDLAYAVSLYAAGKKNEMLEDYFFVAGKGSYLARHKYMYDFEMIKTALEEAGFSEVVRCEYQQGKTPDIESLDIYPDVSLFVEATRN